MKQIVILLICIHLIYGSKIQCNESEYNNYKDWDCPTIVYYFAPLQVQKTLYCIDYVKESSPMHPQRTQLNMTRKMTKFVDVIDVSREIVFSELLKFYYTDPRLTFKNCLNHLFYDFFRSNYWRVLAIWPNFASVSREASSARSRIWLQIPQL